MKKIKIHVSTYVEGSEITRVIEVEDNISENDIDEVVADTIFDMVDSYWEEIENEKGK